jgi:hypothetical protein
VAFRCNFHINGGTRKLIMALGVQETMDHLALKVAACILFWELEPKVELSPKHPSLAQTEHRPDFVVLNEAGEISLWGECGNTSLNKLDKVTRRYPHARIVALRASEPEAQKMRRDIAESLERGARIEVLAFRDPRDFTAWRDSIEELIEVFGEATDRSLNLVINHTPLAADITAH